jgi:hypothetical protein
MRSDEGVKKRVKDCLHGLAADFYDAGRNSSYDMTRARIFTEIM